jgi:hypothetical protein
MEEEERAEGHFGRSRLIHFYAAQHIWAVAPTQPHRTGTSAGQPHRSGTLCPAAPQIWASAAIAPQIWDIMPSSPTDLGVCSHSPTDLGGGWQLAAKPHRFGSKSGLATDLGHFFSKPHRFGFIPKICYFLILYGRTPGPDPPNFPKVLASSSSPVTARASARLLLTDCW